MVSTLSLVCMGLTALAAVVLPVVLVILGRRRWHFSLWSCAVGALVFVVAVLILESATHSLVFVAAPILRSNRALYVLYGSLAAGVFEELGRVCGFAVLRRSGCGPDDVGRPIGAGIGHGGIEAMALVGVAMISSIVTSVSIINAGASDAFLSRLPESQRDAVAHQLESLISTPAPFYLLSIGERAIAIALHITLSVLVWMAFTARIRRWWIFGAILAHALADVGAALYQVGLLSVIAAQAWALVVTVILAVAVRRVYRSAEPPRPREGAKAS